MQLSVKNVDEKVFREFKAKAVQNKMKIGSALTFAMNSWLQKKEKKKYTLLDIEPIDLGQGPQDITKEMDEILY
tara:strand:- start:67 stop:288 length:222 start_codon:yes stop_codon:yes gene_type:complete